MRSLKMTDKDLNDVFDKFLESPFLPMLRESFPGLDKKMGARIVSPRLDMYEDEKKVVVKAEIPGVDKKNINISLNEDVLTIKGEIKKDEEVKDENYYYSERYFGSFARSVTLPAKVIEEKIDAKYKDGILEVTLPKVPGEKQKEVKVKVK